MAVAIVDYGAGNLRSVQRALETQGVAVEVTSDPSRLLAAEAVVLPGVGAAADTMRALADLSLVEPLKEIIASGRPFLGICLGLQVLLSGSEEGGWHPCLDVVPGRVRRLPPTEKVPHMGWNRVFRRTSHPIWEDIPDGSYFYFVHSYYVAPERDEVVAGETTYGITFPSVVAWENVVATQFHPEKSGHRGLQFYRNFTRLVRGR
ncbi:MAG TPA: imidazole glycerol phosphate synthase subunit HisH [Chloroflexota bacterium]